MSKSRKAPVRDRRPERLRRSRKIQRRQERRMVRRELQDVTR